MLNIFRRVTHRYAVLDVNCLVEDTRGRTRMYRNKSDAEAVRDAFRESEPNPNIKQYIRTLQINK
jgi:flagellar biosynthesis protein FlhB